MKVVNVNGGGGVDTNTDVKVLVSANDTTAGYLNGKLLAGTNVTFLEGDDGGDETLTINVAGGDTNAICNIDYPAGTFDYLSLNPAPLNTDAGSNNTLKAHLFDDSTDESVLGQFQVPSDVDTSGTVTFEAYCYSGAASPDGDAIMAFSQIAKADGEVWDVAYGTTESSAAKTIDIQDQLELISWTETISNLSWVGGDFVLFNLFRDADNENDNLTGDLSLVHFRIKIPRA